MYENHHDSARTDTRARLLASSEASGASLIETVRDAAETLRRQRFARQVADELAKLQTDPQGWEANLAEANETSASDGIG